VDVIRRSRHAAAPAPPDPAWTRLAETTGAAARAAGSLRDAIAIVLEDVADAAGWAAAHAWVPGEAPHEWVSSELWVPEDAMAVGPLRRACAGAPAGPARGHLALALHLEATQWAPDLGGLRGTSRYDAAVACGIRSAVGTPVYRHGEPVALLEWYLTTAERPAADVAHALGHLSGVLSEVAERPPPRVPEPRPYLREAVRWVTEEGVLSRVLAS
jgi:hypothetical protein